MSNIPRVRRILRALLALEKDKEKKRIMKVALRNLDRTPPISRAPRQRPRKTEAQRDAIVRFRRKHPKWTQQDVATHFNMGQSSLSYLLSRRR